jgi:non-specific serine/threonine protein kinase/serine/threonine-protein kinase
MEPRSIDRLFWDAAQIASPGEREAFLDHACADDTVLRRRVEQLLLAQSKVAGFLESPAPALAVSAGVLYEEPGTAVGPYLLLELIGEGGMGLVFAAEQQWPVRRKVALKVIKPGMDSRQVIARFEQERQALALMDHPNIARVFDAGSTETGRPYFVMELVEGSPVTRFCDDNHLSTQERLGLFIGICQAVQHAHQKGVIHRDVKPTNVLIASRDGAPVVKVIDFGVAKAVGPDLADQAVQTGVNQVLGTPLYMSPEQAGMSGQDTDTRTDIYSLGVLLYELLTGTTPFDEDRLRKASYDEVRRIIREEEPPAPSARLSTLARAADTVSINRRSDPRRLGQLVRGDLDWIVMKCLEKDRNRRYETASGLAADVRRYLRNEPVLAGPPSASYRLRKFVRRHRGPVLAAVLLLVALLGGLSGTTWGLVRAEQARQAESDASRREAARAEGEASQRQRADAERDRADEERRVAEAVEKFLQVGLLRQADPFEQAEASRRSGGGFEASENPTVRELLDRAVVELTADRIEAKFPKQPRVQAEILNTVGRAYMGVGDYEKAITHLTRAAELMSQVLGPHHRRTLVTRGNLAVANRRAGRPAEAVALLEVVRDTMTAEFGPDDPSTLTALNHLAGAYLDAGQTLKAVALFEKVRDARAARLGPNNLHTLITTDNLAGAYRQARRPADAVALLERVRDVMAIEFDAEHPSNLAALDNLAGAYLEVGRTMDAIVLYEKVLDGCRSRLAPDHPQTLATLNNLAASCWKASKLDRSVPLFEETLRLSEARLGPNHPDTLLTLANLGVNYRDAGRQADGIARMEEALARARQIPGPMPARLLWVPGMLAETYDRGGQYSRSEPLYRWLVEQARKGGQSNQTRLAYLLNRLGLNLLRQGKSDGADPILRESLAIYEKTTPTHWKAFETKALLGGALLGQKKYAEAGPLLHAGYQGMSERADRTPPADRARMRETLDWLIEQAEAQQDRDAAAKWREERGLTMP